jgi:hypothetical protein
MPLSLSHKIAEVPRLIAVSKEPETKGYLLERKAGPLREQSPQEFLLIHSILRC